MTKRIIVIHGRSIKPAYGVQKEMVKKSLAHGVSRTNADLGNKILNDEIAFDFAYYGDINNRFMGEKDSLHKDMLKADDPDFPEYKCRPHDDLEISLEKLFDRPGSTKQEYKHLLKEFKDASWQDDAARVVSFAASLTSLSDNVIRSATKDMSEYLLSQEVGSNIRTRLQQHLDPALLAGDDVCLISHSMGCMVAFDVMWKYSRASEYSEIQNTGNRVNEWITIGCPLGEPGVRKLLKGARFHRSESYPRNIINNWTNYVARDDFVAHDATMEDDFAEMEDKKIIEKITDVGIFNMWTNNDRVNPHNLYGYLDNQKVGKRVAEWIGG